MSKTGNFNNTQDWTPVLLSKSKPKTKEESAQSGKVSTIRATGKPNSNKPSINSRKLDKEENPILPSIPHDLCIQIQQARTNKKMKQRELANALNCKQSLIQSYEDGTAVPEGQFLVKMGKILGVQLKNPKKKSTKDPK